MPIVVTLNIVLQRGVTLYLHTMHGIVEMH